MKSLHKGCKIALGPSKILRVPKEYKSFYAPNCSKNVCDYYFHYDNIDYQIKVHEEITPLSDSDLLGYTESIANIIGGILDIWIEKHEKNYIKILSIIDTSTNVPIQLQLIENNNLVFNIGDIILIFGALFKIHMNIPIISITNDSTVIRHSSSNLSSELNQKTYEIIEFLKLLQQNNTKISVRNQLRSNYFCVLSNYNNFPEIGKYTTIVYDH